MLKNLRVGPAALVLAIMLAIPGLGAQAQAPAPPGQQQGKSEILEKIVVKVNGEILTQSQLERLQIEEIQKDQNNSRRLTTTRELSSDAVLMKVLAEVTPKILLETIDDLLLVQYGKELGIKFSDDNFKNTLENIKKENKIDDQQLLVALKNEGLTMDQLRQNFERQYIMNRVIQQEVMRNSTLTEEEARQYYKAHPEQFMKPPSITVREILIAVPVETVGGQPVVNAAKDDEAKAKIEGLRARALKGEDFAALVAEASESGTKANGGMIGPVIIDELNPAVASALEKLKVGEVSEAIRTRNGYQIFKLETRTAEELEPFDKVRSQLAQKIYESRVDGERKKFVEKLRTQALIEWKDDTYKRMYEQGQAQRGKSG